MTIKRLATLTTAAIALCVAAPANAESYIKLPSGQITPKHECHDYEKTCIDCTFLDNATCFAEADRLGLIDKKRVPIRIDRPEQPLEFECGQYAGTTQSITLSGPSKGTIVCPVVGAVAVDAPSKSVAATSDDAAKKKALYAITTDDALQSFIEYVVYKDLCNANSVVDDSTLKIMLSALEQRPEAQRQSIQTKAKAEVAELVTAAGLPKFCATYGEFGTPAVRKLNETLKPFARLFQ